MEQVMHGEGKEDSQAEFHVLLRRILSDRHNTPSQRSAREEENDASRKFLRQGKTIPPVQDGVGLEMPASLEITFKNY